jgi:hypothetical protein
VATSSSRGNIRKTRKPYLCTARKPDRLPRRMILVSFTVVLGTMVVMIDNWRRVRNHPHAEGKH